MSLKAMTWRRRGGSWSLQLSNGCAVSGEVTFGRLDILGSFREALLRGFQRLPNGLSGRGGAKAFLQMLTNPPSLYPTTKRHSARPWDGNRP
jgi:hypothetical protein